MFGTWFRYLINRFKVCMKTITVREEFSALKEFTSNLPRTFDSQGFVIHNSRNVIKRIDTPQGDFVVKNFKGMYLFNRLAYSLFRKSKAARSYLYSGILNAKGIITPPHVAWIDCYKLGLLTRSYFVSIYYPYKTLQDAIQYYEIYDPSYKRLLFKNLASFIKTLHDLNIFHEDLSMGNILVIRTTKGYQFALVDLNRIKFHKVAYDNALRNFTTLRMAPDDLNSLIAEYAILCGQPAMKSQEVFWKYERRKSFLRRFRRRIRSFTLKPLEKLLDQPHLF
jgi:serine/threonine protein kinase